MISKQRFFDDLAFVDLAFDDLANGYVEAIRNGAVLCMVGEIENQRSLDESVALYRQEFTGRVEMPTNTLQQMSDVHHACVKMATDFFSKLAVLDDEKIFSQKLKIRSNNSAVYVFC